MFDHSWSKLIKDKEVTPVAQPAGELRKSITQTSLLYWEGHCLECAPPDCYSSCMHYAPRVDSSCERLLNGIQRNKNFRGTYAYGAVCNFKKWAKLESFYTPITLPVWQLRLISWLNRVVTRFTEVFYIASFRKIQKPNILLTGVRRILLKKIAKRNKQTFEDFFLECYSPQSSSFKLRLRSDYEGKTLFEDALKIQPGWNEFLIPFEKFNLSPERIGARIYIFPENDFTPTLVFTHLDFIVRKAKAHVDTKYKNVKCLVWDLDNTLWQGTLIEDGGENIQLNEQSVAVIKQLDQRGIIHSICSKNDFEQVWPLLEKSGMAEYFLHPQINWGAKSKNIQHIADSLNLGIDSLAFIDDNLREREEVKSVYPNMYIYSEKEIEKLLTYNELKNHEDTLGPARRLSYLADIHRTQAQQTIGENNEIFLRSLQMQMQIFTPTKSNDVRRCYELIQRSNQLNLTTYRYTEDEFHAMLADTSYHCFAFRCNDKFGDYGIVGFISLKSSLPELHMQDLVISCRIAQKGIENALLYRLSRYFADQGYQCLSAKLLKTKKNAPLAQIFESLPFQVESVTEQSISYRIDNLFKINDQDIVDSQLFLLSKNDNH